MNILIWLRNKFLTFFGKLKWHAIPPMIYYNPRSYKIKGHHMRELQNICKPGDLLLRGYDSYVSSLFIGKWSHVGIVANDNKVIHSVSPKVLSEDILNFFRTDRICILRPNLDEQEKQKVINKAASFIGTDYDFGFSLKDLV